MKKAFTLVEMLIVLCVVAILTSVAMVSIARSNKSGNLRLAHARLATIGMAMENYHQENGSYPTSLDALVDGSNPDIIKNYCAISPIDGYSYECQFRPDNDSYTIIARETGGTYKVIVGTGAETYVDTTETYITGGVGGQSI